MEVHRSTPSADSKAKTKEAERLRRYAKTLAAPDCPVDTSNIDLADLFHEPIYQLVRQQILAQALEKDPAVSADVVRVVHVLSPDNTAYARSYLAPALQSLGDTPGLAWAKLLRTPDRFVRIDPASFLDSKVTSQEYCARYGPSETV